MSHVDVMSIETLTIFLFWRSIVVIGTQRRKLTDWTYRNEKIISLWISDFDGERTERKNWRIRRAGKIWMDPRCAGEMSPQYLGRHALLAFVLGRCPGGNRSVKIYSVSFLNKFFSCWYQKWDHIFHTIFMNEKGLSRLPFSNSGATLSRDIGPTRAIKSWYAVRVGVLLSVKVSRVAWERVH